MRLIKIKKVTRFAFAGALLMTLFSGCEYDYILTPPAPPITEEVKFSTDIIPIFNGGCNVSGCHATGAWDPDLTPANAYSSLTSLNLIDTVTPKNSILYKVMSTGSMKAYSTPDDANHVLAWITQGAKQN
jgi:hypothetical protein